ncbi:hypothetical protein BGZ83_006196 [Gryganskiella cystojenkinii]|nr:hypothetical protein BGZ83_006196 [Gryganskiella cystojenkinii]
MHPHNRNKNNPISYNPISYNHSSLYKTVTPSPVVSGPSATEATELDPEFDNTPRLGFLFILRHEPRIRIRIGVGTLKQHQQIFFSIVMAALSDNGRGDNEIEDPDLVLSQALIRQYLFLERLGSLVSLRELSLTTEDYPLPKHGLSFEEHDDEDLDLDPATASPIPGQTPAMLLESSVYVLDRTVDLCLAKCLDRSRNLKNLEVLDLAFYRRRGYGSFICPSSSTLLSRMRSAGEAEAKWMAEHWSRLRYIRGFGRRRSVFVTQLRSLKAGTLEYSF